MTRHPNARQRAEMREELIALLTRTHEGIANPVLIRGHLPLEWEDIVTRPVPERVRITLRVDADVAKFFRALGPGHQRVMNDVLRAFMLARLTELSPEPKLGLPEPLCESEEDALEHAVLMRKAAMIEKRAERDRQAQKGRKRKEPYEIPAWMRNARR